MGSLVSTAPPGVGCVRSRGTGPGQSPLTCGVPQGVTLTDLQEAERTFSRSRAERQAQDQPGQKPVGTEGLEGQAKRPEPAATATEDTREGGQPSIQSLQEEVSCVCPRCARLGGGGLLLTLGARGCFSARGWQEHRQPSHWEAHPVPWSWQTFSRCAEL